jgi:hypothetical protein
MLRFFAALLTAILSFVVALFVAALLGALLPEKAANVTAPLAFVIVPIAAFALVYRLIPKGRRTLRGEVEARQQQAIARRLPQKALTIAGGGEGVWQTETWRVTGGDTPAINVLENGAWTTVFQARFHPGEEGQWVPSKVTRDWTMTPRRPIQKHQNPHTIHSTKRGGRPDRWEVLVYRPGPWEEALDDHVRAAEDAALARDRDRMGLS